jgi:hypothetical protein
MLCPRNRLERKEQRPAEKGPSSFQQIGVPSPSAFAAALITRKASGAPPFYRPCHVMQKYYALALRPKAEEPGEGGITPPV